MTSAVGGVPTIILPIDQEVKGTTPGVDWRARREEKASRGTASRIGAEAVAGPESADPLSPYFYRQPGNSVHGRSCPVGSTPQAPTGGSMAAPPVKRKLRT